jgi:hypothetical protein
MSPITTQTYSFLHDGQPADPEPAEAPKPATAPSPGRARRPKRKNIFATLRSLVSPSIPTPEPPPDTTAPVEPTPAGMIRLNGDLYRLPRATDATQRAHDIELLSRCFGTVDEIRAAGGRLTAP